MADAPGGGRKAFDIGHPGFKEYAIVIAGALGVFLAVQWYRNRASGTAAAAGTTSAAPILQGPGPGSAALWLALQDLAGKTTTTTTTDNQAGTSPPPVSRENRSPEVQHQIHQIHGEHQRYERNKRRKSKPKAAA